jgi:signal transduction histidine kinase
LSIKEIEDDGKGIDPLPDPVLLIEQGHYGFTGMKERAEAINGEFQLRTGSEQGTTMTVKVPINRKQS